MTQLAGTDMVPASSRAYREQLRVREGRHDPTERPRNVADTRKVVTELIEHTTKIAEAQDRGDLVARLARARTRIGDPQIRVVIAGQLKQGKSLLLNSLLNMPVARVGDDESTVLATVVSYAEQPSARLVVARPDGEEPELVEIPTTDLGRICAAHRRPTAVRCCASR